jgi:hypothetical protein
MRKHCPIGSSEYASRGALGPQFAETTVMWAWIRRIRRPAPADRAEALIDHFIEVAKRTGAESPREAAEKVAGAPLTEEEWARYAPAWCRRWY